MYVRGGGRRRRPRGTWCRRVTGRNRRVAGIAANACLSGLYELYTPERPGRPLCPCLRPQCATVVSRGGFLARVLDWPRGVAGHVWMSVQCSRAV